MVTEDAYPDALDLETSYPVGAFTVISAVRFAPETETDWAEEGNPEHAAKVPIAPLMLILGTEADTTPRLKVYVFSQDVVLLENLIEKV